MVSTTLAAENRMATKRVFDEYDFVEFGPHQWKGDLHWREEHGKFDPFIVQQMKAGWEEELNKQDAVNAGGLHSSTAPYIEKLHIVCVSTVHGSLLAIFLSFTCWPPSCPSFGDL